MNDHKSKIYLAAINHPVPQFWPNIAQDLGDAVNFTFSYIKIDIDLNLFYSEERKQYHSTLILSKILNQLPDDGEKIIGVVNVDIFIPILTFLFGEAQLGGRGAIVSTHRLHNEFYGLPPDDRLLYARTVKEILHELGHLLGLVHCRDYQCVMHSSTFVEDIDLKEPRFCTVCQSLLSKG